MSLKSDEKECARCKIPLKKIADSIEKICSKEVDLEKDKMSKRTDENKPCNCWECPKCKSILSITK